jgi:putative phosphoribosyl transferase
MFASRIDAAHRLAERLIDYKDQHPLILAIPRGAVPMGRVLADTLGGELDVVLVRKIGAPGNAEFAVGAVDETGWAYVADHAVRAGADDRYLREQEREQLQLMRRRRAVYTPGRAPIDPRGKLAIVIDDGLATGATMIAALHAVRAKAPRQLICAVPVASQDALKRVRPYADEMICVLAPPDFHSVGQFYRDFDQVDDAEVVEVLAARN